MKVFAKNLVLFLRFFIPLGLIVSCGPGVEYTGLTKTGVEKPPDCSLNIFMPGDILPPNHNRIGMINIGENMTGTSMSCGQQTVIEELKKSACAEGADAIHIYQIKPPSMASTCYRMNAYFYTSVPKVSTAIPNQKPTQISSPPKSPVQAKPPQSDPDIHFDEFTISPERAKVGEKFQLTVRYTASDPEKGANESLPISFHYEILIGEKRVFKSKPRNIQSPNNHSTFKDFDIGAKKRGEYLIRINLMYYDSSGKILVGKMSQKTLVIE